MRFWKVEKIDLDSDGDGLYDWHEYSLGLSAFSADTDFDGFGDAVELSFGSNAADGSDFPPPATLSLKRAEKSLWVGGSFFVEVEEECYDVIDPDTGEIIETICEIVSFESTSDIQGNVELNGVGKNPEVVPYEFVENFHATQEEYAQWASGYVSTGEADFNGESVPVEPYDTPQNLGAVITSIANKADDESSVGASEQRVWLETDNEFHYGLSAAWVVEHKTYESGTATTHHAGLLSLSLDIGDTVSNSNTWQITQGDSSFDQHFTVTDGEANLHPVIETGTDRSVTMARLAVKDIRFGGDSYYELMSDDRETLFEAPHWVDIDSDGDTSDSEGGEKNYAVSYTSGTIPSIGATISIPGLPSSAVVSISAEGSDNIAIPPTPATRSGDEFTIPLTPSTGGWPNEVKFYDKESAITAFRLDWSVEIDGHELDIGTTTHQVYLTWQAPNLPAPKQESILYLGCKNARGLTLEEAVRNFIYWDFRDQKVYRLGDENPMTYWKGDGDLCITAEMLLESEAGDGNCAAWARLLIEILQAQGIPADLVAIIPQTIDDGFHIKYWVYTAPFTGPPEHPYVEPVEAFDVVRVKAQGNDDSPPFFHAHWITTSGNKYFDPSYGTAPISGPNKKKLYEDQAFSGFMKVYVTLIEPIIIFQAARPNDTGPGAAEVIFSP